MKTRYDAEADALYVRFDGQIEESEVSGGVVLDFDAEGGSSRSAA
jgi:uncharacterized protein YuzE